MREIKFRAWDEEDNEMNYYPIVYPIVHDGKWYGSFISFDADETRSGTLMQYTGLKDKNGKEIYEGDILKDFMAWGDTAFREVFWEDGEWLLDREFTQSLFRCLDDGDHDYVVAGNIFEHPELLEK